ncbi:MAG: FKBP-type peptidyl-prolyl cis-trans isomerase [Muribaculum sp.]|nr:FKBP-type peptidyl-prolyl cis-trans isomerase [Muribaculum sp.]
MNFLKTTSYMSIVLMMSGLCSCLDSNDNEEDYTEWRKENEAYLDKALNATSDDGTPLYTKIVPDWASSTYTLIQWHNDRSATSKNLTPMDNSTVDIKYAAININEEVINSSYSLTANGDSIYRTTPASMITGVRAALANMHVGDSVTLVMPYTAAYGTSLYGSIKPYSTLKFNLKLVSIPDYEKK